MAKTKKTTIESETVIDNAPVETEVSEIKEGDIFINDYPDEAFQFCYNSKGKYTIVEISKDEDGHRRFQIVEDKISLDELKEKKRNELKIARDENEQDYFIYDGNRYNSDQVSCTRITDTVLIANAVGDGFKIIWTDYDNVGHELNKDDMTGLLMALGQHSQACHYQYNALKEQIANATTEDEINAIVWTKID